MWLRGCICVVLWGVETSLRLSRIWDDKNFQHRLEDGKITRMGEYIILFSVSSFELPTTYFLGGFFVNKKKAVLS